MVLLQLRIRWTQQLSNCIRRSLMTLKLPQNNNGIGIITLSSHPVNSLSLDMFHKIVESIDALESDENCNALILTSSCKVFSSGLDLNVFNKPSIATLVEYWKGFQKVQRKLYNSRLFTLAGINGHAIAGGCILSLCCDERIITSDAKIGLNETTFGLMPPPFAVALMTDVIGKRHAYKALTLGTMFSADDALSIGLVDEVYKPIKNNEDVGRVTTNDNQTTSTPAGLDDHCMVYITKQLRITTLTSQSDANTNSPSNNITNNTAITNTGVPGRSNMKSRLHKPLDDFFYGTPALIQQDVNVFVEMIMNPLTQSRIENYLMTLSAAKNKKK